MVNFSPRYHAREMFDSIAQTKKCIIPRKQRENKVILQTFETTEIISFREMEKT